MIIVMEQGATEEQVEAVIERLINLDFSVHRSTGAVHTVLGGIGPTELVDPEDFRAMDGVRECHRVISPYKLASRSFRPEGTVIRLERPGLAPLELGGSQVVVLAGPAVVESEDQIEQTAAAVAAAGARILRACVWPTRVSPYGFRGLGEQGLTLLRRAADRNSLFVLCEVLEASRIPAVSAVADILMVGAGNMNNVALLAALGAIRQPVLLKRGVAATLEELLLAAEVLLAGGNYQVALCERGIRTFSAEQAMDLGAIPALKRLSHLPVLADPSHGTGRRDKVAPMARAAVAAGADGLLVEVHPEPDKALVDAGQSIRPEHFAELMAQLRLIGQAVGRSL